MLLKVVRNVASNVVLRPEHSAPTDSVAMFRDARSAFIMFFLSLCLSRRNIEDDSIIRKPR